MKNPQTAVRDELVQTIAALEAELARAEAAGNASIYILLAGDTPLQFVLRDRKPVTAAPCDIHLATRFEKADAEMIAAALPARPDRAIRIADSREAMRGALAQTRARLFAIDHQVNVINWLPSTRQ
ncbi:hypothetical protein [Chitinilyticum aquatile]|uniref:hypothetical protein n=1 Tax=Chitinilyticum aquatile TaxID=362520 RepID=UPI0004149D25|nr:hypothetical protein [Chitinilyticum aquatile]